MSDGKYNHSSSLEESSTVDENKGKNMKNVNKRTKYNRQNDKGGKSLTKLLKRIDNKQVPKQEMFNEESGQNLESYLKKLEMYCEDNFKGDREFWIGELERHLNGKTLESFKSLRNFNYTYETMKGKFLAWYKGENELRKNKYKKKFRNVQIKHGESLFLFSNRLETIFKLAYPKHNVQSSRSLVDQFQSSVPKSVKEMIKTQVLSIKLENKKVKWGLIQNWARLMNVEKEKEKQESEAETKEEDRRTKEIVINLSRDKDQKRIKKQ